MPPSNTGSKGALITWTVVSTVFGVTCMVLAIVAYSAKNDAEVRLEQSQSQYGQIVGPAELGGTEVNELRSQKQAAGSNQLDLTFAINQGRDLAQQTAGTANPQEALAAVDTTVRRINESIAAGEGAVATSATTLADAARNAAAEVERLRGEVARLQNQQQQQVRQSETQQQALRDQIQQTQAQLASAQDTLSEQVARGERTQQTYIDLVAAMEEQVRTALEAAGVERTTLANAVDEVTRARDEGLRQLGRATGLLSLRIGGDALVTQPDGTVIRSPSDNRLTIDLGRRDGVTTGMTFAIYDATTGVPRLEGEINDPANVRLPLGKADIEIINVGQTSSEARIVRQIPGQTVREGDVIANLAFSRETPRRFFVYGDFDFNNDGQFSPREGQLIASLVGEFGGQIVRGVNVDTDIVVLGREPVIPTFSEEQLRNPINRNTVLQAQTALREYQEVQRNAQRLNKTIINQNTLLALMGYTEIARR